MSPNPLPQLVVRAATPADAQVCGQICYDAFSRISERTLSRAISRRGRPPPACFR